MSYAQDNGYTPQTFAELMDAIRTELNTQFSTSYTADNFVGTNWYKYFYALVQQLLLNETKTSEIFLKLQEYIATTNLRIQRPSVSQPGLIDSFESEGYTASVKKNLIGDAGTVSICINTDGDDPDYATTKLAICTLISQFVTAGMVTLGTESETITLSNGQDFDFKFALPDETAVLLRCTLTSSDNQSLTIPDDEEIRQAIFDNIKGRTATDVLTAITARYRLGWDFEPQRYYTAADAPWAATILLEWSDNAGSTWHSTVFEAAFDDLYTFDLGDIAVSVDP